MKWIKTAIGAVIAISVIPIVVLCAINIKKSLATETEKITITTELKYPVDYGTSYGFNPTIYYVDLIDYFEEGFVITNLYDYTHDINITITNWNLTDPTFLQIFDNNSVEYRFLVSNSLLIYMEYESIYNVNITDIERMDITFTRTIENVNLPSLLISFIPLIFAGGVVLFYYKSFKKD